MKLISLYIENFGGLHHYTLNFETGITTVLEPNGFGKTTLAEFIRAMFYGFPRKSKTLEKSRRQKYTPWNGGQFGGNLVFEHGGQRYRAERTFGAMPKEDTFALIDLSTNKKTTCFSEELGQEIFGLDADSFERSTYLPQMQAAGTLATASIQAKLTELVENSGEMANFEKAIAALRAKRSALIPYRGNGGSVAETAAAITALQIQLDAAKNQQTRLYAAREEVALAERLVEATQQQLVQTGEELKIASRQAVDCLHRREYEQLCERHRNAVQRLAQCRKKYPCGMPQEEALHRAEIAAEHLLQNGGMERITAELLRDCRNLCAEYEKTQEDLRGAQRHLGEMLQAQEQRPAAPQHSVAGWILCAAAMAAGGVLAWMQMQVYALMAFGIGAAACIVLACLQSRKKRIWRRKAGNSIAALQAQLHSLHQEAETCSTKIEVIFAKHGITAQPQQYSAALVQLEHRASQIQTANRELQTFFAKLGLTQVQDSQAALQQLRADIRIMQAAEAISTELEAQIEAMETRHGDMLFAEFSATQDPCLLREAEQALRAKLTDATSRLLHARQSVQLLREQTAEIPQLREKLKYHQQKLKEERENVRILDATMELLYTARENLSTAYLGTIRSRFADYLTRLDGVSAETFLIDTDFQVQFERLGKVREMAYFSAGQADLVMLCMRLALVDALFKEQEVCIILDDPFVNLDDTHMAQARKLLQKIASERQILYLTCHSSRKM
ncbi:MAG: AAA family ATPase [Oscillospiraceae bacterium]|nr:AAA family ATPase [Oscillospiraceae bacterium]